MTFHDPMAGILSGPIDAPPEARLAKVFPIIEAKPGLLLTHRGSGFSGTLLRIEGGGVEIRGRTGAERVFRHVAGAFSVDGKAVSLARPARQTEKAAVTTASGSRAVPSSRAKVARGGRIWVEGVHDAALIERVWGDDLREEGVVVERLDGIDHLANHVRTFQPGPARRLGVLVDHLVPGSKESRIAEGVAHPHVLVTGTPFVDVWQAIRPQALGIDAWPVIPKGVEWKTGVCEVLGFGDPSATWRTLLASVNSYADLEPSLVGAVEQLIDFVTEVV